LIGERGPFRQIASGDSQALTAVTEAVNIRRELAERRPGAHQRELEQSLQVAALLEHDEDLGDGSPQRPEAQ